MNQIIKAAAIVWVLLIVLLYYTSATPFTRGMLAIFLPTMMGGLILERATYRSGLRFLRRRGSVRPRQKQHRDREGAAPHTSPPSSFIPCPANSITND